MITPKITAFSKYNITGVILTLVFLISVVLGTWIALIEIEKLTKLRERNSLQTVLQTTQEALYMWINLRLQNVLEDASSQNIRHLTQELLKVKIDKKSLSSSKYQKQLRTYLTPLLLRFSDKGFFIISPDRINIGSSRNINLGQINLINKTNIEQLDKVFKGETIFVHPIQSDVPLRIGSGRLEEKLPTTFVVAPILNNNNNIIAAIALRIDPFLNFSRISQLGRIGDTGETYAFNRDAKMITESRFDHQLRQIGLLQPATRSLLNVHLTDPGGNMLQGFTPVLSNDNRPLTLMAQSAISGISGNNTSGYRDYRGVRVFGAWLWDRELGFGLATEIDESDAMQSYYATRAIIVVVLFVTVILGLFLSSYLAWLHFHSEFELKKANDELENRVNKRTFDLTKAHHELEEANRMLSVLATTDKLTNLANRRYFDKQLDEEWRRCQREKTPLSLILIDIDFFKNYNDTYGHRAGDDCLKKVSLALRTANIAVRQGDLVARYGGEEFAIILSGTAEEEAYIMAKSLCNTVKDKAIKHSNTHVKDVSVVTISLGVATVSDWKDLQTPNNLIENADQALYLAKSNGRNHAVPFSQLNRKPI